MPSGAKSNVMRAATIVIVLGQLAFGGSASPSAAAEAGAFLPAATAPILVVTPVSGMQSTGVVSGPIRPASQAYVVSNAGGGTLSWTVNRTSQWFNVIAGSLSLASGRSTTTQVSIASSTYSAQPGFYSETIRFRNLNNGQGDALRVISLTLFPNTTPVAHSQEVSTGEDTVVPIGLEGDDPDGQALGTIITALPERGALYQTLDGVTLGAEITTAPSVVSNAQRMVFFRPWRHEHGQPYARFRWQLRDALTNSVEATVTVWVTPTNDPPVAVPDRLGTLPGVPSAPFDPLANDEDPDGDVLTLVRADPPAHGRVEVQADGRWVYVPEAGQGRGEDRFSYTVADPAGATATTTVTVQIGVMSAGDWPMPGGGPNHSGYYPARQGAAAWEPRWWVAFSNQVGSVALADRSAFVASSRFDSDRGMPVSELTALDLVSGRPRWRSLVATQSYVNPPAWSDGRIYVQHGGAEGHRVVGFDGRTGERLWATRLDTPDGTYRAPVVFGDGVFVKGYYADGVHGLSTNGAWRFFTRITGFGSFYGMHWSPSYYRGALYCWDTALLYAVDPQTGDKHWKFQPADPYQQVIEDAAPAIDDGTAYVVSIEHLRAIDLRSRTLRWSRAGDWMMGFQGTPAVARGVVYVRGTNRVYAFRAADGALVREYVAPEEGLWGPVRSPIVTDDVLFASFGTNTYVFDLGGGIRQTIPEGGELSLAQGTLVISGPDAVVRAYAVPVPGDVSLRTALGPVAVPVWNPATVTFVVTNTGPGAAGGLDGVRFLAPLPEGIPYLRAEASQGGCAVVAGEVRCALGALPGGTGATVNLTFLPTNLGTILLTGRVESAETDAKPGNEQAVAMLDVRLPMLQVDDSRLPEGAAGLREAKIEFRLSATNPAPVSCRYFVYQGAPYGVAAASTNDFLPTSGLVVFPPGVRTQYASVMIQGDPHFEPDEAFLMTVGSVTNATFDPWRTVVGTIVNDDAPPVWTITDATAVEGGQGVTNLQFRISLWPPGILTYSAAWTTLDGTARAGSDYWTNRGQLLFLPGQTSQVVTVSVTGDRDVEPDETFSVALLDDPYFPSGQDLVLGRGVATGRILNDDGFPGVVDHFLWDDLPAGAQHANRPFREEVIAVDYEGTLVESFNDQVPLGMVGAGGGGLVGAGREPFVGPFGDFQSAGRCSSLYLADELGPARRLRGIALEVDNSAGEPVQQLTVRLKHTTLTAFGTNYQGMWESNGWTTVFQAGHARRDTGWMTLEFSRPFEFNGRDQLVLDLSYWNGVTDWIRGRSVLGTDVPTYRSVQGHDSSRGDPKDWIGPAAASAVIMNARFLGEETGVEPASLQFTNGRWAGTLTVREPATNVVLRVDDGAGRRGDSAALSIGLLEDLRVGMRVLEEPGFTNLPLRYVIGVTNDGTRPATAVVLRDELPAGSLLANVVVSQGFWGLEGTTVRCDLGTLEPGAGAGVEVILLPTVLGTATNRVSVTRAEPEFYTNNNAAVVRTEIRPAVFLSVSDASVTEGATGFLPRATFAVNLAAPAGFSQTVTVSIATSNGTASAAGAGWDYYARGSLLTFPPGTVQRLFEVETIGDFQDEPDEVFYVTLAGAVNATVVRSTGIGTIRNDDWSRLSVSNAVVIEGHEGTRPAVFDVTLLPPTWRTVAVHFATANLTAVGGADYAVSEGWLEIPPGATNATIAVPVLGDRDRELDESFSLNLDSPDQAVITDGTGVGTIRNDDLPGLVVGDATFTEDEATRTNFAMRVSLTAAAGDWVTFDYFTVAGTARAGDDFVPMSGRIGLPPGTTTANLPMGIVGDLISESTETFTVVLTNLSGADPDRVTATGTILDNDGPPRFVLWSVRADDTLGDGDGGVDPGESVRLRLGVRGTQEYPAAGARAALLSLSPLVTVVSGEVDYPLIPPGGVVTNQKPFVVRVSKAAVCGASYPLQQVMTHGTIRSTNGFNLLLSSPTVPWKAEPVDTVGEVGQGCSLAVDSEDRPHVSYHDATAGAVKYATWRGSNWVVETISAGGIAEFETSLALDGTGRPRVAYAGPAGVMLAVFDGTTWVNDLIPDTGHGVRPSLVLSNGQPRIAFYDSDRRTLRYSRFDGGRWLTETVDDSGDMGRHCSLALRGGRPCVAYSGPGTNGVRFGAWNGTNWVLESVSTNAGHGLHPALALTGQGHARMVYGAADGRLYYVEWTGTNWNRRTLDQGAIRTPFTALRVDALDVSHLAYHSGGYAVYLMVRPGGLVQSWSTIEVTGESLPGGYGTNGLALALDSRGRAMVAYHVGASRDLRLARRMSCEIVNLPPVTWDHFYAVGAGAEVNLRFGASDPDGDPDLGWTLPASPLRGTFRDLDRRGTVTYVAPVDFAGVEIFEAVVSDGWPGGQARAAVTIEVFPDEDGDGMDDRWETGIGLDPGNPWDGFADDDADGANNREEFRAGTDPEDPSRVFRVVSVERRGAVLRVRVRTESGRRYRVVVADSVTGEIWRPVGPVVDGTGGELLMTLEAPAGGFYRVEQVR